MMLLVTLANKNSNPTGQTEHFKIRNITHRANQQIQHIYEEEQMHK